MSRRRKKSTHASRAIRGLRAERLLRSAFDGTREAMTFDQVAAKLGGMDNMTEALIEECVEFGGRDRWLVYLNRDKDQLELSDNQGRLIGVFPRGQGAGNWSGALACMFARETWHETRMRVIRDVVRSGGGVAVDRETQTAIAVPTSGPAVMVVGDSAYVERGARKVQRPTLGVPVDDAMKCRVRRAAEASGVSVAEWCRRAIASALVAEDVAP